MAGKSAPSRAQMDACERAMRTARCEIGRLRGYARIGRHEDAMRALGGALAALAELDALAAACPALVTPARRALAELDAATGGACVSPLPPSEDGDEDEDGDAWTDADARPWHAGDEAEA
jgi:hypothetical protein